MKNSEETGKEFMSWWKRTLPPDHHEDVHELLTAHTDAVSYECQKHILKGLLQHAAKHWVRHWSEGSNTEAAVWDHEMIYINQWLDDLEAQFNPQPTTGPVDTHQEDVRDRAPQFNKFADNFRATHIHLKSQGLYKKLYDASEEQTMEHVVVYCNAVGETFTRPAKEFYDIERFQELLS